MNGVGEGVKKGRIVGNTQPCPHWAPLLFLRRELRALYKNTTYYEIISFVALMPCLMEED